MEIRKVQAEVMRRRAQGIRAAACDCSSGVSRALLELADSIDAEAASLEAKSGDGGGRGAEGSQ